MPRRSPLTHDERAQIRAMHDKHPRMPQRMIAAKFGVSGPTVNNVLNYIGKPTSSDKPKVMPTPACTVQQPGSIIRPIPLSRLTARR